MKHSLSFLTFFVFISLSILAQDKWNIEHTIHSEVFGKERKISVTLPERYFLRDSLTEFSATYILDTQYSKKSNSTLI